MKNSILDKWKKIGLSSLVISFIMRDDVFAEELVDVEVLGNMQASVESVVDVDMISKITLVISMITGLSIIIITKIKAKKQKEPKKVKKWVKILFVVSIILFILSCLAIALCNFENAILRRAF